jgi:group I intron endonuclease
MEKGKIYGLTCPISNEIRYVGQTTITLNERLCRHIYKTKYKIKNGKVLTHKENWLKKLIEFELVDKIKITLLEECDIKLLNEREIYWISDFKSKYKLTNLTDGGEGTRGFKMPTEFLERLSKMKVGNKNRVGKKHSEKTKKLISKKVSGKNNGNFGKPMSEDRKNKIGNANSGENNGMFGVRFNMTDEHKESISEGLLNSKKLKESRQSQAYKDKISKVFGRPIYALDIDFNIVAEFDSMTSATEFFKCKESNIFNARRDKRMISRKYWVVYKEDYKQFKIK